MKAIVWCQVSEDHNMQTHTKHNIGTILKPSYETPGYAQAPT